jgi:hypothetical protein
MIEKEDLMPFLSVPFTNTEQEKPFWCWAAVAANVYNSMRPPSVPAESQCDVATLVQGAGSCGGNDGTPDVLSQALNLLQISDKLTTGPNFIVIEDEFEGVAESFDPEEGIAEPVCAEIIFPDSAHFAAISAIDTDTQHVWVADPFLGGKSVEFTYLDFVNNYGYSRGPKPGDGTVQNFQRVVNKWQVKTDMRGPDATNNNNPANAG